MQPPEAAASPRDGVPASAADAFDLDALTGAERRALALALAGLTMSEIAERLGLVDATARDHLARAYGKLGVAGRVELAARVAAAAGRDDPPPERTEDDPDPTPASELPLVIALVGGLAIVVLISLILPLAMVVTGPALIYLGWRLRQSRRSPALGFAALWVLLVGVVLSVFALILLLGFLVLIAGGSVPAGPT